MKVLVFLLLTLVTPALSATPHDGVYSTRDSDLLDQVAVEYERQRAGIVTDRFGVLRFSNTYLSIKEREDGTITLLKRNLNTNQWQAFAGYREGSGYRFINKFNRSQHSFLSREGIQVRSEEIYIEFDESGNGLYSHTLFFCGEFSFKGVLKTEGERIEITSAEPITRFGAVN